MTSIPRPTGRVIRATPVERRLARAQLQARRDAQAIREAAEAQAAACVARAHGEAEQIRAEAHAGGVRQAHAQVAAHLVEATRIRDRALAQAKNEIVELAIDVARHILRRELDTRPEHVMDTVERVLRRARRGKRITVYLHPDDRAWLAGRADELRTRLELCEPIHLEPDASLERGDCVVTSHLGSFDARLCTQLEALRGALQAPGDPPEPT